MPVRIVTDSVSDISPEVAGEFGITVVPLNVVFGDDTYRDGIDMTTDQFYERLAGAEKLPTSATPSPQAFTDMCNRLAADTDEILVITISHKLSATSDSALKAVEQVKVVVIDSQLAMMVEGLLAIAAAKAARAGAGLDELVKLTERNIPRVGMRIAFDTLEYLKRGGRIGKAQALLGSMLGINPILGIKDGEVFPFGRERSRAKAIDHLYAFVAGYSRVEELAVEDATTPDEAEELAKRLNARFPRNRVYRAKVSPVIGTNVGPKAMGVAVLGDR